jgi:hypothetical protein
MAEQKELPQILARTHEKFKTPYVSLLLTAIVIFVFTLQTSFLRRFDHRYDYAPAGLRDDVRVFAGFQTSRQRARSEIYRAFRNVAAVLSCF